MSTARIRTAVPAPGADSAYDDRGKPDLTPAPDGYPIKLVRDRTAAVLNTSGKPGDLWYGECPPERVGYFLRLKLAEEVGEFLVGGGANELADVLAVVHAIGDLEGWPVDQIAHKHPRGGFAHGVMMFGRHDEFDVARAEADRG